MEFNERTIKVIIDEEKCEGCKTHACVDACKTYSRGILILKDGKPAVEGTPEDLARKGTECLPVSTNAGSGEIRPSPLRFPLRDWRTTAKSTEQNSRGKICQYC